MDGEQVNRSSKLLRKGQAGLALESAAIAALQEQLDESFVEAVDAVLACQGHVVVSGAGTSSAVARRLAHLLTCVGAPALFLDAGQSAHGSAAAVRAEDIVLAISKGGETDELTNLVRVAREKQAKVISLTENKQSSMARLSDVVLCMKVDKSVDGHGVIALGSSLAAAALGDALCFAVLSVQEWDEAEFLKVHPGGAVGKRLLREHGAD